MTPTEALSMMTDPGTLQIDTAIVNVMIIPPPAGC
jgi:hypothetical protein